MFSRGSAQSPERVASGVGGGQVQKGITIAAAKYSSEDVATLVQYTIALIEYRFDVRLCFCIADT